MLYNVSTGIQRMALNTIRRHPNAWNVQFFRKVIDRPGGAESFGGLATLGGAAVLDSQDEPDYHYEFLVNGYAMRADGFNGSGMNMTEAKDAPYGGDDEFTYALATELPPPAGLDDTPALPVELTTKDLVLFVLGEGEDAARLAYEIVSLQPTMELPPYLPRYVLNRAPHFDIPAGAQVPDPEPEPAPETVEETTVLEPESTPESTQINPVNSATFLE